MGVANNGPEPINPRMILECRSKLWKVFYDVASSYPHAHNVNGILVSNVLIVCSWVDDPTLLTASPSSLRMWCALNQDVGVWFFLRTSTSVGSR